MLLTELYTKFELLQTLAETWQEWCIYTEYLNLINELIDYGIEESTERQLDTLMGILPFPA